CYFGAGANLYGAQFKGPVNMTYLTSKEPIRVFWLQFQDHWLQDLEKSAVGKNTELGSEDLATKVREIVTELEFWKDNFNLLGHRSDAADVNFELIMFAGKYHDLLDSKVPYWLTYVLSLPNGYGSRPFRPLWFGMAVICLFAVWFRMR